MSDPADRPSTSSDPDGGSRSRVVLRWYMVLPILLALVLGTTWLILRSKDEVASPTLSSSDPVTDPVDAGTGPEQPRQPFTIPRQDVTLYWVRADGAGLITRPSEVFATASLADRVKQVVGRLLAGPDADPTLSATEEEPATQPAGDVGEADPLAPLSPFPTGTQLRAAFVDGSGVAHVSLSKELTQALGGSAWERLVVHSLVNSVVRSFPEVRSVRVLIEGAEVETLAGHVDLRHPVVFSDRLVVDDLEPEASEDEVP
ncbi:MAG: GerMN domain-containing protein [Acidobacteriota bacterium]